MQLMTRMAGFSVIEVLVALIVISIGLLGLANLQLAGMRQAHSAMLHSQATTIVHDMVDRMRGNFPGFSGGGYDTLFADAAPSPGTVVDCELATANCTSAQLALADLVEWKCMLGAWQVAALCGATLGAEAQLPDGDGEIVRNGNNVTVTIRWADRTNALPPVFSVTTSMRP